MKLILLKRNGSSILLLSHLDYNFDRFSESIKTVSKTILDFTRVKSRVRLCEQLGFRLWTRRGPVFRAFRMRSFYCPTVVGTRSAGPLALVEVEFSARTGVIKTVYPQMKFHLFCGSSLCAVGRCCASTTNVVFDIAWLCETRRRRPDATCRCSLTAGSLRNVHFSFQPRADGLPPDI